MNTYQNAVKFVNESFQGKQIKHFEQTVYWLGKLLNRELSEAEKIAAYLLSTR